MILVDVYVPVVDATYDFMLDENIKIEEIVEEISGIIAKKMKNTTEDAQYFSLYSMMQKRELDREETLYSSGIKDGNKLMLI